MRVVSRVPFLGFHLLRLCARRGSPHVVRGASDALIVAATVFAIVAGAAWVARYVVGAPVS